MASKFINEYKYSKEKIAEYVGDMLECRIEGDRSFPLLTVIVDAETEKKEILVCIDSTLKNRFPEKTTCIFLIDLSTMASVRELSEIMAQKISACQDEEGESRYRLFVFDNLGQANEKVLNWVKDIVYHDNVDVGGGVISLCNHDAEIWDTRFAISTAVVGYKTQEPPLSE